MITQETVKRGYVWGMFVFPTSFTTKLIGDFLKNQVPSLYQGRVVIVISSMSQVNFLHFALNFLAEQIHHWILQNDMIRENVIRIKKSAIGTYENEHWHLSRIVVYISTAFVGTTLINRLTGTTYNVYGTVFIAAASSITRYATDKFFKLFPLEN